MTVEIKSVAIGKEEITIEGLAIEQLLLAEDLYEDVEVPEVTYEFSHTAHNGAAMKYLYKLVQGQKRCATESSFGARLDKLVGAIVWLPESFRVVEA